MHEDGIDAKFGGNHSHFFQYSECITPDLFQLCASLPARYSPEDLCAMCEFRSESASILRTHCNNFGSNKLSAYES